MKNRRSSGRHGMTLFELLLVLVFIFIFAAVVAPRFSDFFPGLQIRKAADGVYASARKARGDAATLGARHRLVFDDTGTKYWIEREARPLKEPGVFSKLGGSWSEQLFPDGVLLESFEIPDPEDGDSSKRQVEFRTDGTATGVTLVIANEQGERRTIKIAPATGSVTIEVEAVP